MRHLLFPPSPACGPSPCPSHSSSFARRRLLLATGGSGLAALLAGCDRLLRPDYHGVELDRPHFGHDFEMPDIHAKTRRLADFNDQALMVFFGFTQCPDICPTALARAADIKQLLGPQDAQRLTVAFVTIDPERDTPEILQAYLQAFDASFIGLRGNAAQTAAMARDFNVHYEKVPTDSGYTMDHTASTFVFGPQGRLRLLFRHEASAADCADDIRVLLKYDRL